MRLACLASLVLVLAACDASPPSRAPAPPPAPPPRGFLLVSAEARAANARLDDGTAIGPMPLALGSMPRTLIVGGTRIAIEPDATLVTYAYAADGTRDVLVLDGDVYRDRLAIDASPATAAELATALDARAEATGDGHWILRRDDIWDRAAALAAAPGVREVFAVEITRDGAGTIARRDRMQAAPAPSPWVPVPDLNGSPSTPLTPTDSTKCEDPIAGTWIARTHRGEAGDWYEFTLHVVRSGSTALTGTITVRFWEGEADDPKPTMTCDDGSLAIGNASMQAAGTWKSKQLDLRGTSLDSAMLPCGLPSAAYQLDRFRGAVRADGVLVTKNNDGGSANDRPYLFRRTSCL